jgi:TP901 family phage tail tape measure protein
MVDEVQGNINVNIDTSAAIASLKRLQGQISKFHTDMARGGGQANREAALLQQNLINSINKTGQFSASMTKVASSTEAFTTALEKNKLSMGQHFRYAMASTKSFGKMFTSEFSTIQKVAESRVRTLQTQFIGLGRDANGALSAIKVRPLTLDMNDLATKTQIAAQKAQIFNKLVDQGATNLLNWGKNTQWAGRQLMVGFTIPLTIFASTASKAFMEIEKQVIAFKRVYGDFSTTKKQTDDMAESVKALANEFTQYGIAVKDTMSLAAKAAAMGKTGADLTAQIKETSRLAVLGQVDQQQALDTTISLTNAFGLAADQLAGKIDFLNAVENQTVTSIEDLTVAIPKAGPVIQQLGGNVEDLSFLLTAMREGGINASEGANALKSGLAALINPTKAASDMLAGYGINIQQMVQSDKGNVKKLIVDFASSLDKLDPLSRARAIEQMFGKFQFSRISTLFQNVIKEGSQAQQVLKLASSSSQELSILSQRELSKVSESTTYKFEKAITDFQTALAPVGEQFLKLVTPIIEFGTKMLEKFNGMDDGIKGIITTIVAGVGVVGPVLLMTIGLFANAVANIISVIQFLRRTFGGTANESRNVATQTEYMTQAQLVAEAAAAGLNQTHSRLIQTYNVEAGALANLTRAYEAQARAAGLPIGGGKVAPRGKKYASGGIISGPGSGTSDSIPAMLSNGEAVIPAKQVKKYGGFIHSMISDTVPGFAGGGILGQFKTQKANAMNRSTQAQKELEVIQAIGALRAQGYSAAEVESMILTNPKYSWLKNMPEGYRGGIGGNVGFKGMLSLKNQNPINNAIAQAQKNANSAKSQTSSSKIAGGMFSNFRDSRAGGITKGIGIAGLVGGLGALGFGWFNSLPEEEKAQFFGSGSSSSSSDSSSTSLLSIITLLLSGLGRRYANGVVSVPGPKGAGDVVPAMLSPGEAVIPTAMTKKYGSLINGMISDNIPGYNGGKTVSYGDRSFDVAASGNVGNFEKLIKSVESGAAGIDNGAAVLQETFKRLSSEGRKISFRDFAAELMHVSDGLSKTGLSVNRVNTILGSRVIAQKAVGQSAAYNYANSEDPVMKAEYERAKAATEAAVAARKAAGLGTGQADQIDRAHQVSVSGAAKQTPEGWAEPFWVLQASDENQMTEQLRINETLRKEYIGHLEEENISAKQKAEITRKITNGLALTDKELMIQKRVLEKMLASQDSILNTSKKQTLKAYAVGTVAAAGARATYGITETSGSRPKKDVDAAQKKLDEKLKPVTSKALTPAQKRQATIAANREAAAIAAAESQAKRDATNARRREQYAANKAAAAEAAKTAPVKPSMGSRIASGVKGLGSKIAQGGFGPGMGLATVGGMVSMVPGLEGVGMAASLAGTAMMMIPGPIGMVVAGLVAAGAGIFAFAAAQEEQKKKALELAEATTMSIGSLEKMSEDFGTVSVTEARRSKQSAELANVTQEQLSAGQQYLTEMESGKKLLAGVQAQKAAGMSVEDIGQSVAANMANAVAQNVITQKQGETIIAALGVMAGNTGISSSASNQYKEYTKSLTETTMLTTADSLKTIKAKYFDETKLYNDVSISKFKSVSSQAPAQAETTNLYGQAVGGIDIINSQYDAKIKEAKTQEEINRLEDERTQKLKDQNSVIRDVYQNLQGQQLMITKTSFNQNFLDSIKANFSEDSPTYKTAKAINDLADSDFKLRIQTQLESGTLDSAAIDTLMQYADPTTGNKDFGALYDLSIKANGEPAVIGLISSLNSAGGDANTATIMLNFVKSGRSDINTLTEGANAIAGLNATGNAKIDITANDGKVLKDYSDTIKTLEGRLSRNKGKFSLKLIAQYTGSDKAAKAIKDSKIFQGLPKKIKKQYLAEYKVLMSGGIDKTSLAYKDYIASGGTEDGYVNFLLEQAHTSPGGNNGGDTVNDTTTDGGGGGGDTTPEDRIMTRLQARLAKQNALLNVISLKEKKINELYDERKKALEEIAAINANISQQQQSQLDLANALATGDVAAAAKAVQAQRATAAAYAQEQQMKALEEQRQNALDNVMFKGKTRADIEAIMDKLNMRIAKREYRTAATGGMITGYSVGGKVMSYMSKGGKAIGSDTVPAMLTPGEFVVRRPAVQKYGVDKLKAINSGQADGGSVYNYSVTVNAATSSNADQIAQAVMQKIKQVEGTRLRGNRY